MEQNKNYISINGSFIEDTAIIGKNVTIYPGCYILGNSVIGDDSIIYSNCYIKNTKIGHDCLLYPNNYIENSSIGNNCQIYMNNYINKSTIYDFVSITFSHCEESLIHSHAKIGPYSRLRPNAIIGEYALIGDYVEVKNSTIGDRTMASHLAYIGDVDIGKMCNIGCGAIFVNYNGREKHRSIVGDNVFLGSNCNVIAPVNIEKNSYICAGTTITKDVKENDFVIGRSRQEVKHGRAEDYLKEMM